MSICIIQTLTKEAEDQMSQINSSLMLPLLSNPNVMIALMSATSAAFAVGFIESLLELHLQIFSLDLTLVGLCFFVIACTYTICTLVTGWATDTR